MMSSVFIGRGTQIQQSYQALYKDMNKRNFIVEDDLLSEHIAYCKIWTRLRSGFIKRFISIR